MQKNIISPALFIKTLLVLVIFVITACSEKPQDSSSAEQLTPNTPQVTPQKPVTPVATSATTPSANTGIVKSMQVAGSYSYIETDINGTTFWIATAASAIKVGEKISWNDYAMMKNFTSKALNKTFDQIMFVDKVRAASTQATSSHTGTVVETMNASGYSYIQVDEKGNRIWLAAPEMAIKVGQEINWSGGAAMQNFSSRSLDRTFDEIYFVGAVQITNG